MARPVWLFSSGPLDRRLAAADLPITPNAQEITARINPRGHRHVRWTPRRRLAGRRPPGAQDASPG